MVVGIVGMTRAEGLQNAAVILTALIGIANQECDRRSGCFALEYTRQNFDPVLFFALGYMARGTWLAAI